MLFKTSEQRERWFANYEDTNVPLAYGSAMEHASTVNLGAFGNRQVLKNDVARILAIEVNRYRREIKCDIEVTAEEVLSCNSFHHAFDTARIPIENETEKALEETCSNYTAYLQKERTLPENLHAIVSHEILKIQNENLRRVIYDEEDANSQKKIDT